MMGNHNAEAVSIGSPQVADWDLLDGDLWVVAETVDEEYVTMPDKIKTKRLPDNLGGRFTEFDIYLILCHY